MRFSSSLRATVARRDGLRTDAILPPIRLLVLVAQSHRLHSFYVLVLKVTGSRVQVKSCVAGLLKPRTYGPWLWVWCIGIVGALGHCKHGISRL